LAAEKMHKNPGGFRYDFTESQVASCKLFQCQNRRFRVFEAGYWKDFHQHMYRKYLVDNNNNIVNLQKNIYLLTQSFQDLSFAEKWRLRTAILPRRW
jgi:hypothetical protein